MMLLKREKEEKRGGGKGKEREAKKIRHYYSIAIGRKNER